MLRVISQLLMVVLVSALMLKAATPHLTGSMPVGSAVVITSLTDITALPVDDPAEPAASVPCQHGMCAPVSGSDLHVSTDAGTAGFVVSAVTLHGFDTGPPSQPPIPA
jgi:hypothetical protein